MSISQQDLEEVQVECFRKENCCIEEAVWRLEERR
jgi:hypothetical protein